MKRFANRALLLTGLMSLVLLFGLLVYAIVMVVSGCADETAPWWVTVLLMCAALPMLASTAFWMFVERRNILDLLRDMWEDSGDL